MSFTVKLDAPWLGAGIRKARGWCEKEGIEHSWQSGPSLTCDPPIQTRVCVNCGKRQHHVPGYWDDAL